MVIFLYAYLWEVCNIYGRMEMGPHLFNKCDTNIERPPLAAPRQGETNYSHIKAFEVKLALLVWQVQKRDFTHLPVTQSLSTENPVAPFPAEKSVEALEMLKAEFEVRFHELHVHD